MAYTQFPRRRRSKGLLVELAALSGIGLGVALGAGLVFGIPALGAVAGLLVVLALIGFGPARRVRRACLRPLRRAWRWDADTAVFNSSAYYIE